MGEIQSDATQVNQRKAAKIAKTPGVPKYRTELLELPIRLFRRRAILSLPPASLRVFASWRFAIDTDLRASASL
jgi:hypothetical protein